MREHTSSPHHNSPPPPMPQGSETVPNHQEIMENSNQSVDLKQSSRPSQQNVNEKKNDDLVWDINSLNYRDQAREFIMKLENNLCVYSATVEQLYTNYEIAMPVEENHNLVILPNPYAYHDTFNNIPSESIRATGLYIVPGQLSLQLVIPLKRGSKKYRNIPLEVGLKMINNNRPADRPLLPVLMKGDLREFNAKIPTVHLHSIAEQALTHLSSLDVSSIRNVILERLEALMRKKLSG